MKKEKSEYDLLKYIQECGGAIVFSDENTNKATTLEDLEYNKRYIRFLLSRDAGFIKWLVENEKIDYKELPYLGEYGQGTTPYESLLMLLAISDEPINFLISILKSQSDERVNGAINTLREVPEK